MPRYLRSEIAETADIVTRARVVRDDTGGRLAASDCSAYSLHIFDEGDDARSPIYSLENAAPSEVLLNAYSVAGWAEDSTGYNFLDSLPSDTPARYGGAILRLEYNLATVSEGNVPIIHLVELTPVWNHEV